MKKIIKISGVFVGLLAAMLLYVYIGLHRSKYFQVSFLNIGQGDGALIQFENGQKMMVDCGPSRLVLSRLSKIIPFYDRTIDYVLATHPDLDHYGGCVDVLKEYHVKQVIVNGRSKPNDPYWREWSKIMREKVGNIKIINGPETLTIGSSTLSFLSPDPGLGLLAKAADNNNFSIVFHLQHGPDSFLFTGDMEGPLENALLRKYCRQVFFCPALRSTVLKIGHHGSESSSSEAFLRLVHPKKTVISVGKNHYGHPSPRILKRLERLGTEILRTDQLGDITIYPTLEGG